MFISRSNAAENFTRAIYIFLICSTLLACGSGSSSSSDPNNASTANDVDIFGPVSAAEVSKIEGIWASRDLSPTDIQIVLEDEHERFTIYIIEHQLQGRVHYGAVIVPTIEPLDSLPILVMPDGLDQQNPVLDMDRFITWNTPEGNDLEGFIQIYPGFRGRAVQYNGFSFDSPGDFCDAWDGATDDTISFLTAALSLNLGGDSSKILGVGISRGGNTVFQLALRDPRITTVISMAGPVDFNRQSVRTRYGSQYTCQFITGKSQTESRDRIIASSPIYFTPLNTVEKFVIIQGGADPVVPAWNATEMNRHLSDMNFDTTLHVYPNEGHGSFWGTEVHTQNYHAALNEFIESL